MKNTVQEFSRVADKYCQWAESLKPGDDINLDDLFLLLADLLNKVLLIPDSVLGHPNGDIERFSHEEWTEIYRRFTLLKFQYYREIFDPHDLEEDEPVTSDLHDDLADIYCDLKPALSLYKKDQIEDAAFEWKSTFGYHWGEHLISALRAIYMFER